MWGGGLICQKVYLRKDWSRRGSGVKIMGYRARYYESQKLYAITFRTIEGLPFVATLYMKLLIRGIMARVQRDMKVTLCHFIWMGNHAHVLAIFKDPQQAANFYGEVQKKLTESLKALLGLGHLRLWEGRPVVAQVLDLPAAIQQIAYLYANPARANLIDSISHYPGCSSWEAFQGTIRSGAHQIDAKVDSREMWVPYSKIPLLPAAVLKKHADIDFAELLSQKGRPHTLDLYPNAWMKCFGVTSPERIADINEAVLKQLAKNEQEHQDTRSKENKGVLGERLLRVQPVMRHHIPKRTATRRRVFVICSDKEQRISFISKVKALCELARQFYQDALQGVLRNWPPGMFKPPLRPLASALG